MRMCPRTSPACGACYRTAVHSSTFHQHLGAGVQQARGLVVDVGAVIAEQEGDSGTASHGVDAQAPGPGPYMMAEFLVRPTTACVAAVCAPGG